MHNYVHDTLMTHVVETYCCPEKFTREDLCELKEWGKAMYELLKADTQYNIVEQMENGDDSNIEMTWNEFAARLRKFYADADATTKVQIKSAVNQILI